MAKGKKVPRRNDTQETLIGSPVAEKPQCASPTSLTKQCRPSNSSDVAAVRNRGGPRRSSTNRTLFEEPEDQRTLDKSNLKDDDEEMGTSHTYDASPTTFSPSTPDNSVPLPSTASSASSADSKRWIRAIRKRFGGADGESWESIREDASLFARGTLSIAEASNIPYLKGVAAIAVLILESADGAAANKEQCVRIADRVKRLLVGLGTRMTEMDGMVSRALEEQVEQLTGILHQIRRDVKELSDSKRSYFKKFTRMERDREIIKRCDDKIRDAFQQFQLHMHFDVLKNVSEINNARNQTYDKPLDRLGQKATGADRNGEQRAEVQRVGHADISSAMTRAGRDALEKLASHFRALPADPEIFYGRTEILDRLVKAVLNTPIGRVAILGPGGIGKSSLALKLLHREDILTRYGDLRYFVPCDPASCVEDLMGVLASHLGIRHQETRDTDRPEIREAEIMAHLMNISDSSRPIIIVLDNFESPWEPDRTKVEKFLARLGSLDNVALVITLRGLERPSSVKWSLPLFPPLDILDPRASRETFIAISDAPYKRETAVDGPDELDELLTLCGHLPLAITLMANLAGPGLDTVPELVDRWKRATRSTTMLNNGEDAQHSLEVSIELSLTSPRVRKVPDAIPLLSLLALLPGGLREGDLEIVAREFRDVEACRLTLIKTALAFSDKASGRLKVLAPIRAFIAGSDKYVLVPNAAKALEDYYWKFIEQSERERWDEARIRTALPELGNIENLIDKALQREDAEPLPSIKAAVNFSRFVLSASSRQPRITHLQKALRLAQRTGDERLQADCLYAMGLVKHRHFVDHELCGQARDEFLGALSLYKAMNDKIGEGDCLRQLASIYYTERKFEDARDHLGKAYQVHAGAGCLRGQASARIFLAKVLQTMNEPQEALERAQEAREILRQYHDPVQEARCLHFLGNLQCSTFCNYVEARKLLHESSRIYKTLLLEESSYSMNTTCTSGEVDLICSLYEAARDAFQKAARVYHRTNRRDWEAYSLIRLGLAYLGLGSATEAAKHIHAGRDIWKSMPKRHLWGLGISYLAMGDVAMHEGSLADAENHYREALSVFKEDSRHWKTYIAGCLLKLGSLFFRLDQREKSRESVEEALQLYEDASCRRGKVDCMRQLAELSLKNGSDEQAKRGTMVQIESVMKEYEDMGLPVERQRCAKILNEMYRLLGEKPPKNLQLQIRTCDS